MQPGSITCQAAGFYINVPNFGRPLTILNSSRVCTEKLYRFDVYDDLRGSTKTTRTAEPRTCLKGEHVKKFIHGDTNG